MDRTFTGWIAPACGWRTHSITSSGHVRKGGIKYRYYLSSPLLHGQPERAGSVARVPAAEVEARFASVVREHLADRTDSDDRDLIRNHVVRVELQANQLVIELKTEAAPSSLSNAAANDRPVLRIPWKKTPMTRRRQNGIKYRYYLSSALLQGQPERAGAVSRIPAAEIEGLVLRSVREHLNPSADIEDAALINTHVARVEIQSDQLLIELTNAKGTSSRRNTLKVPWHKTPLKRRREILVPASVPPQDVRAIRSENRALLVSSIARGRRWLNELITDPTANAKSIATRDGCSVRKVNMTISFAFLAPDLVKAAIEGRLPHGMGVVRLADLPAEWSRQYRMLGLPAQ